MSTAEPRSHGVASALRVGVRAVRAHAALATLFMVATVGQGALQGLLVWTLREVLVRFSDGGTSVLVLAFSAGLILAIWLLRALSSYFGEVTAERLARRVEIDQMQAVLRKLLTLPVRFFERTGQGDLVMASYTDLRGVRTVTNGLGTIVLSASRVLGLATVAWLLSPPLAAIGMVAVPLGVVPAFLAGRRITAAARRERKAIESLYDSYLQVSTGIRVIKVNRGEPAILDRAQWVGQSLYQHTVRQVEIRGLSKLLLEAVSGFGLIAVLVIGGREVAVGGLEWQSLLSLLVAVVAVYAPILSLLTVYAQVRGVIPNLDRIDAILGTESGLADAPHARRLLEAPRSIQLDGVGFAYNRAPVLDGISATFYRGETIGIVGPSGAGKSTLVALMLRLYDPTRGRVLFDGADLRGIRQADVFDQCAIVLQEPFLFIDTVANNIRVARPEASMDEVTAAARAANVHDDIMAMERGYDTVLGYSKEGRGVSVGQKQRICIAAALLKNAPILFLDEATSNLDAVSERAVQQAIDRLMEGRTTFVIAHRFSTLRTVDRILVLDNGRMAGLGAHDELLKQCATYRELWENQTLERRPEIHARGSEAHPDAAAPRMSMAP